MAEFDHQDDQAGGLRRIMAGPQPRLFSLLPAVAGADQSRLLANLAVSLRRGGSEVLVIDASSNAPAALYDTRGLSTLAAVVTQQRSIESAIRRVDQGYAVARLMPAAQLRQAAPPAALNQLLDGLARRYDVVLLDAELTSQDVLPLPLLNEHGIIIQLNRHPDAIKQAYRLIKRLYNQLGCRTFGILLLDTPAAAAGAVFDNLSQVARRYLAVRLELMGVIPSDEHLQRAGRLGRAVVEAFPTALASMAFGALARRLDAGHASCAAG